MAIFNKFISLNEAGPISGYHADNVGAFVRLNKLKGRKVGNKWYVSRRELKKHLSTKHHVSIAKVAFLFIGFLVLVGMGIEVIDGLKSQPAPVAVKSTLLDTVSD